MPSKHGIVLLLFVECTSAFLLTAFLSKSSDILVSRAYAYSTTFAFKEKIKEKRERLLKVLSIYSSFRSPYKKTPVMSCIQL